MIEHLAKAHPRQRSLPDRVINIVILDEPVIIRNLVPHTGLGREQLGFNGPGREP